MKTDIEVITKFEIVTKQVAMIKNIDFVMSKDEFTFSRKSGRYLFSTKDIDIAYAYIVGICNERVGLDG